MINVLFAADFPISKSGIVSTASSILATGALGSVQLYSMNPLSINGAETRPFSSLSEESVAVVFTHTEYSALPTLCNRYPEALYHVGDWPLRHWNSVRLVKPFKGTLAMLRCLWRLRSISLNTRLAFVTQEDRNSAVAYGFSRAVCLPIGVTPPNAPLADQVDVQSVCFSGNFRYPPNRDAAQRLIKLARAQLPDFKVILVGYYADDFKDQVGSNVHIYSDVSSVVDLLAVRRPIYVSLIDTGAGAKNKILEAMVAGCPIICTPESLDSSIPHTHTIRVVTCDDDVKSQIQQWALPSYLKRLTQESSVLAVETRADRSWLSVAKMTHDLIASCTKNRRL